MYSHTTLQYCIFTQTYYIVFSHNHTILYSHITLQYYIFTQPYNIVFSHNPTILYFHSTLQNFILNNTSILYFHTTLQYCISLNSTYNIVFSHNPTILYFTQLNIQYCIFKQPYNIVFHSTQHTILYFHTTIQNCISLNSTLLYFHTTTLWVYIYVNLQFSKILYNATIYSIMKWLMKIYLQLGIKLMLFIVSIHEGCRMPIVVWGWIQNQQSERILKTWNGFSLFFFF